MGACFSVLAEAGAPTDALCLLRPALLFTWFIVVYGMQLLMALRMQLIFINRSMKSRRVSTGQMLKKFGVLLLAHAAVLAIWFGVSPPKRTVALRELAGEIERGELRRAGLHVLQIRHLVQNAHRLLRLRKSQQETQ